MTWKKLLSETDGAPKQLQINYPSIILPGENQASHLGPLGCSAMIPSPKGAQHEPQKRLSVKLSVKVQLTVADWVDVTFFLISPVVPVVPLAPAIKTMTIIILDYMRDYFEQCHDSGSWTAIVDLETQLGESNSFKVRR